MSIQIGNFYQLNEKKLVCVKKHAHVFTFHRIDNNGVIMQKQYINALRLEPETYIIGLSASNLQLINLRQTQLF